MKKSRILLFVVLTVFLFVGCKTAEITQAPDSNAAAVQTADSSEKEDVVQAADSSEKEDAVQATDTSETEDAEQPDDSVEKVLGGKRLQPAPERPHLAENIEILDVEEGRSDYSLMITFANHGDEDFQFVQDYALDVKIAGQWYEYAAFDSYYSKYINYTLKAGRATSMAYEMWMHSLLPEGEYRLTTHEGIYGEFVVSRDLKYDLSAVGDYPDRTADEIYLSMTESCGEYEHNDYSELYIYEKRGFHDVFYMYFPDDKRFGYSEGMSSSYFGIGNWKIEGNELVMTDDVMDFCNYFLIEDNVLIYEAEKSSGYIYTQVLDGERFICDRALWEEAVKDNEEQRLLYHPIPKMIEPELIVSTELWKP